MEGTGLAAVADETAPNVVDFIHATVSDWLADSAVAESGVMQLAAGDPGYQGIGLMGQQIEAWHQKTLEKLDAYIGDLDSHCDDYTYYELSGVKQFLTDLRGVVGTAVTGFYEGVYLCAAADYDPLTHNLRLSTSLKETLMPLLVHELTHALDYQKGWNLCWYSKFSQFLPRSSVAMGEQLAACVQHIFEKLWYLERFEDRLKAGGYEDEDQLNAAWEAAWGAIKGFANTSWTSGFGMQSGRVSNEMFELLTQRHGGVKESAAFKA